jgi:hypothetical protein
MHALQLQVHRVCCALFGQLELRLRDAVLGQLPASCIVPARFCLLSAEPASLHAAYSSLRSHCGAIHLHSRPLPVGPAEIVSSAKQRRCDVESRTKALQAHLKAAELSGRQVPSCMPSDASCLACLNRSPARVREFGPVCFPIFFFRNAELGECSITCLVSYRAWIMRL